MKALFGLLGVSAVAVAVALLMGYNGATVSLFWPPHRLDLSLNLALVLLAVLFLLLHLALKALALLRQLPAQARRWRQQQLERAVVQALLDAVAQLLAGRFARAQTQGRQALEHLDSAACRDWSQRASWVALGHLLLAEAAHGLRETDRRHTHLQAIVDSTPVNDVLREGALMRALRWAIEDRDLVSARRWWSELPQGAARRIHALRLKLRLARLEQQPVEALETARLLAKHGAFSRLVARSLVRSLAQEAIAAASDLTQLRAVWQALSAPERDMPELALAVAQRATSLPPSVCDEAAAAQAAWQWLEPMWSQFATLDAHEQQQMALTAERCLPHVEGSLALVEQVQRQWPDNASLRYLSGQACMQRGLWGKASQALQLALPGLLQAPEMQRRAWLSLAQLAQDRGDPAAAAHAWHQAAMAAA